MNSAASINLHNGKAPRPREAILGERMKEIAPPPTSTLKADRLSASRPNRFSPDLPLAFKVVMMLFKG